MKWPEKVSIKEVGPRDGLQNEKRILPTVHKIEWINRLSETGLSFIEATSFENPNWIPQLSDAKEVVEKIKRLPGMTYGALVSNTIGLQAALEADLDDICVLLSASETHNQSNLNQSIPDTFSVLEPVIKTAINHGKSMRAYVSTAFGCPYEGEIDIRQVSEICGKLFDMGIEEISLGDTIGIASPRQVEQLLDTLLKTYQPNQFAMHFHDTQGMALANIVKSLEYGISTFDASLGGLGGCSYAPGASGNVATEDLHQMLTKMGIETGIDGRKLKEAAFFVQKHLKKPLLSHQMSIWKNSKQTN